ncbi:hypothetical protein [Gallaecimonas pentaromativorans]|uniref:hypothetical protein n=1 Tax=Gallaecimonas pentaromativorans TaxID=584787 RepID=UPI003A940D53
MASGVRGQPGRWLNPDAGSSPSGSFSFESVDGLQVAHIGGQSFTLAELQALAGSNAVRPPPTAPDPDRVRGDASGGTIASTAPDRAGG